MLSDSEQQLYRLFNEIGTLNQLARSCAEQALPAGLTLAQFGILDHFMRLGGEWAPLRLAGAFQVTKQTMTSTLARMEAAGLVATRPDPEDRRAKLVALTPLGGDVHKNCLHRMGPALALMVDRLPAALVETLLPLLADLQSGLEKTRGAKG